MANSPELRSSDGLFRRALYGRAAVGRQSVLVDLRGYDRRLLLPAELVSLADQCRSFATLDEHAQLLVPANIVPNREESGSASISDIRSVRGRLQQCVASGLLVSHHDFLSAAETVVTASNSSASHISTIGFLTKDRPQSLCACVTSYSANLKRHRRVADLVVCDDSTSQDTLDHLRALVKDGELGSGITLNYVGPEQKESFRLRLAERAGVPAETVEFALMDTVASGYSYGSNRNALALHTAGDMILTADDDTVCDLMMDWNGSGLLALDSRYEPRSYKCFKTFEEASGSLVKVERDVLGIHEHLLGKLAAECVCAYGVRGTIDTSWANDSLIAEASGPNSRIAVTINGLVGDCGIGWPNRLLTLNGPPTGSWEQFRAAWQCRQVTRVSPCTTISNSSFMMSTFCGLDNRLTLPPFFPFWRNSDGLFGFMLQSAARQFLSGLLPVALAHKPVNRNFGPDEIWLYRGKRFTHLLKSLVQQNIATASGASLERGLQTIGQALVETGRMNPDQFVEQIRMILYFDISKQIQEMERRLSSSNDNLRPSWWADVVGLNIDSMKQSISDSLYLLPWELRDWEPEAAWRTTRNLIRRFGELLICWPPIVEAARELRHGGYRLAVPL